MTAGIELFTAKYISLRLMRLCFGIRLRGGCGALERLEACTMRIDALYVRERIQRAAKAPRVEDLRCQAAVREGGCVAVTERSTVRPAGQELLEGR